MKKLLYLIIIAGCFASCNNMNMANNNAAMAKNKAQMQAFVDNVINKHNPAAADSVLADNFVDHTQDSHYPAGKAGVQAMFKDMFTGCPDVNMKINFMVADSNTVVAQYTMSGTNSGPMMGMPATNKQFKVDGVDIVRYENGKAVERWGYSEQGKMMMQLGMMPDMSKMMADSSKMNMDDKKMEMKGKKK